MNNELFYTVTSLVTVFVTNYIFYDFFKSRHDRKCKKEFYFIYLIFATFCVIYVNKFGNVMSNYIVNFAQYIILGLLFKLDNKKDWILNISFFLVIVLLDMLCYIMVDTSISFLGKEAYRSLERSILEMILASMILFIVYYLAKSIFYQRNYIYLKTRDIFMYISISVFSWLLCFGLTIFSTYFQDVVFQIFTFIVTIVILVLNVIFISFEETLSKKNELERNIELINEKSESVLKYYKRIEEKEEKSALFMHDIKNHLQTIQNMMHENEDTRVDSYFDKLERAIEINNKLFFSENKVLEVLINDKIEAAKNSNIEVEVRYDNTDISFISEFDLVTVLANMFDNAIDELTLGEYSDSERKITLYIRKVRSYLIIKMINPSNNIIKKSGSIIRTTKKNHTGLGIMSIKSSLAKYKAECHVESKDGIFMINATFPMDIPF